jgi:hypothetical protein
MPGHRVVEADQRMFGEVFDFRRLAMTLDAGPARVDRPDGVADLAAHQFVVVGVAGAQGDIRVALTEVYVLVAHHELHAQRGVPSVEAIEQPCLHDAIHDRPGAGQADHAGGFGAERVQLSLKRLYRALDRLGEWQHLLAERGQAVAGRLALHERLASG